MPETIYETTNKIRDNDGFIYDIRCKLLSQHDTIIAHIIHNSPIDGERVTVRIQFTHRWATVNSETDYDEVAGWACRLYRDLPPNHLYGSGSTYNPDQATFKRLLTPGIKDNNLVNHSLLQLLHDFYVSDPDKGISVLSAFMSLEFEKDQVIDRLKYIQTRELIRVIVKPSTDWSRAYSISPKSIEKIEEQLQLNVQFESRYFKEVDIELSGDFVFVIMPFREEELEQTIYHDFIKPIVEQELSIPCERVDGDLIPERIDNKIYTYIKNSKFLIAELTTNNANVIYELAMAHMLNKRVVILTQNDPPKLAFDFDKFPATIYANKEELKSILPDILKSTFKHS